MDLNKRIKWTFWLETGIAMGILTIIWMTAILVSQVQAQPSVDARQDREFKEHLKDAELRRTARDQEIREMYGAIMEIRGTVQRIDKNTREH